MLRVLADEHASVLSDDPSVEMVRISSLLQHECLSPLKQVKVEAGVTLSLEQVKHLAQLCEAGASFLHEQCPDTGSLKRLLLLSGWSKIVVTESGSVVQAVRSAWKKEAESEFIAEDSLLLPADLIKKTLEVSADCGDQGKRRACKDCSCGLADRQSAEDETKQQKSSSCGNCYLGDAYRCGGCPYRGMPAFAPGETVTLPGDYLQDDLA